MNLIILILAQASLYEGSYPDFENFWDFYADNRISSQACGRGYTGVANTGDISSTFINPASLSLKNKKQIYFEYVYKDDLEWIADIKYKNLDPNFSLGFGLPVNDYFQTGIVYRIENSRKTDYGEIQGTVVIDTAEGGYTEAGTAELYKNTKFSSFSVPLAFNFINILTIGIDLSYTNFYSKFYSETEDSIMEAVFNDYTAEFNKIRPKIGVILFPIKNLSMGLTFLPEVKENATMELTDTTITYAEPNIFPLEIGIGISYQLSTIPLTLSLDYNYSKNSAEEGLVNRNDIHFGVSYDIHNNFILRGGFFTQGDYRTQSSQSYLESYGLGNFDQIFTTFGISYKISSLTINLSLMDSHLLSTGSVEQTYFNTGISYGF
ncbi:MAG: hypothetical protein P8Z50_00085 [candidate division WOR-3 bacterium]